MMSELEPLVPGQLRIDQIQPQHGNLNIGLAQPGQIKQLQRLKRSLYKKLMALRLPENPLDHLIAALGGPEQVG